MYAIYSLWSRMVARFIVNQRFVEPFWCTYKPLCCFTLLCSRGFGPPVQCFFSGLFLALHLLPRTFLLDHHVVLLDIVVDVLPADCGYDVIIDHWCPFNPWYPWWHFLDLYYIHAWLSTYIYISCWITLWLWERKTPTENPNETPDVSCFLAHASLLGTINPHP